MFICPGVFVPKKGVLAKRKKLYSGFFFFFLVLFSFYSLQYQKSLRIRDRSGIISSLDKHRVMDKLSLVYLIGALTRLAVPAIYPSITYNLSKVVELSTPLTSFTSLEEAFYYLKHGIDLYDGGIIHHPPLLVAFLNIINVILPNSLRPVAFNIVFTMVDLVITSRLIKLNHWYNEYSSKRTKRIYQRLNDDLVASFYLLNPLLILTNLCHSTIGFTFLAIIEAMYQFTVAKNILRGSIALAVASYLSLSPFFLLVPMFFLVYAQLRSWRLVFKGACTLFATIAFLLFSSFIMTGSWKYLQQCYQVIISFSKITPNLGLWWYLFTEMFESFTCFYLGVFNIYSVIFILPIAVRLFEFSLSPGKPIGDSFLAIIVCYLWLSLTKSYPCVADLAFGFSLLTIFKDTIIKHCHYGILTILALFVCVLLSPIFYYCWIVLGNGNSNFFYSMSLMWGIIHGLIITDILWVKLANDYITLKEIPEDKIPNLRLTQVNII